MGRPFDITIDFEVFDSEDINTLFRDIKNLFSIQDDSKYYLGLDFFLTENDECFFDYGKDLQDYEEKDIFYKKIDISSFKGSICITFWSRYEENPDYYLLSIALFMTKSIVDSLKRRAYISTYTMPGDYYVIFYLDKDKIYSIKHREEIRTILLESWSSLEFFEQKLATDVLE